MTAKRHSEAGFTLIELMVALAIFSLISVAGVALLRSGSDTQIAVKARLETLSRSERLSNLLEADLAQALPRPTRNETGQPLPAFMEDDGLQPGMLMGLVKGGWSNFDAAPRADVQRVAYTLDKGVLRRLAWPMLDGSREPSGAVLAEKVISATLRFRDDRGEWRTDWTAEDAEALPRAVELKLQYEGQAEQRMLFLVGPQVRPELDTDQEQAAT